MFAEFNLCIQRQWDCEKKGSRKKDELGMSMWGQDEVNDLVYCSKLAFSLFMMRRPLASRFSEAIREERLSEPV